MNIPLLKKLDALIGKLSATIISPPVCRELASPLTSLLIIRPGGICDAVLLAPAIQSLKKNHPTIHIIVLAERRNASVFPLKPGVDRLLCCGRLRERLQALRGSFDAVIDSEQWHRLSVVVGPYCK